MAIGTKAIEQYVPIVKYNEGLYTALPVYIAGDLTVTGTTTIAGITLTDLTVTGNTTIGNAVTDTLTVTGATSITSTSANALAVGANGATNPVLKVVASTASVATGLSLTGAAAAGVWPLRLFLLVQTKTLRLTQRVQEPSRLVEPVLEISHLAVR